MVKGQPFGRLGSKTRSGLERSSRIGVNWVDWVGFSLIIQHETLFMAELEPQQAYRVLARKYRPSDFSSLIGQDSLVRTLTNAIESNRIAQAFMLTGVRGVGKTTTARIIARALNCIGVDGKGGATPSPCGECTNCVAIREDRHVDVLEIDAASHNGVDQVRELSETVHYHPSQGRYRILILDEVHMLTQQAFNAILKTLEEPPPHVKFIFATTEIRKVPVTVLSRCQRFDLRRVPIDTLMTHYGKIAEQEQVTIDQEALRQIAAAADGSVRDGLSLLDQAIALSGNHVTDDHVRDMLGLADRGKLWTLYESMLKGEAVLVLEQLAKLYQDGADSVTILQDLLEITHFLTSVKMAPNLLEEPNVPELEKSHATPLLDTLSLASLSRFWQVLLGGLEEIRKAPHPFHALEMVLIRLMHLSETPPFGPLLEKINKLLEKGDIALPSTQSAETKNITNPPQSKDAQTSPHAAYEALASLMEQHNQSELAVFLRTQIIPLGYKEGVLSFRPITPPRQETIHNLTRKLKEYTGKSWLIQQSNEPATKAQEAHSVEEARLSAEQSRLKSYENEPIIQSLYKAMPMAKLVRVNQSETQMIPEPPTESE